MPHFANLRDGGNLPKSKPFLPHLTIFAAAFALAGLLVAADPLPKVVHAITSGFSHD